MTNTPNLPLPADSIVKDAAYLRTNYPHDYRQVSALWLASLHREALRPAPAYVPEEG